jgi:hypothetical protein
MNRSALLPTIIPPARSPVNRSPLRRGLVLILLTLVWFALCPTPKAFGVTPAPDGGYPVNNTAEGDGALFSLTTGGGNTANGFQALFSNTTGSVNTANGSFALYSNTTGVDNTGASHGRVKSSSLPLLVRPKTRARASHQVSSFWPCRTVPYCAIENGEFRWRNSKKIATALPLPRKTMPFGGVILGSNPSGVAM